MAHSIVLAPSPAPRLKLDTLVRLRWLAVIGQTAAVVGVALGMEYPLPLGFCLGLIALSAWLNLFLKVRYPATQRLADWAAAALLAYDILQLAALLYLTGGLTNPFAILLIAPVMVSATALKVRWTVALGVLVVAIASALAFWFEPLPWSPEEGDFRLPSPYLAGIWTALVCALGFMAAYSFRVAEEARQLHAALTATELVLSREQHLHQLDGLAAAAAHELGTPLATIALVAKELEREIPPDAAWRDDISLLRSQSERCREILKKLTSLSTEFGDHLARQPITHLLEDVIAPHREFGIALIVHLDGALDREPVGTRNPAILYGLGNIVENAVDFARSRVDIGAAWTDDEVVVTIRDDGPGFAPDVIDKLGEPYVTTRGKLPADAREGGGLGLGFFIAKTLLERTGARVEITNRAVPETGAVITVRWPREVMDEVHHESG
ncbi:ActS/PrrB/RegB family redox-sensitive histidine kinase [Chthonobacter albigriseus]|uniref:ActS/PrrB/RegB family redox-sensitive histidine kinase n=1 Tax=Chthonobacter albigriseus TaxID=1683161 RepID=UPI0015EE942D|nr:ActS/PrrB/RegB family redox-sensitive histidine kinase [Chthonobacter albigriseus]